MSARTIYTIHDGPNAPFQTTDAERAELAARAGAHVTAVTVGDGSQKEDLDDGA